MSAWEVSSNKEKHVLILTSLTGISKENSNPNRDERIDLHARYFSLRGSNWHEDWNIKDGVDCPALDFHASFLVEHVAITDLNYDGKPEMTIPYRLFCGGSIEPDSIKIILRQDDLKLALRGEELIAPPDITPFGGEYRADKDLYLPRNSDFLNHIKSIWLKVYRRKIGNSQIPYSSPLPVTNR